MSEPRDLSSAAVVTIDVEWAHPSVLLDVQQLLDEREIRATFFCTHPDIELGSHERALHPNFRRSGESMQRAIKRFGEDADETKLQQAVVDEMRGWYPDAAGVRAHSLFCDSTLLPLYASSNLSYDSSYALFLAPDVAPVWKECAILELPIFYMDHLDLLQQATGFNLSRIPLTQPGLKIFDFHPNLIYVNAVSVEHYNRSKAWYHDPAGLLELRREGPGVRTLFIKLLDTLSASKSVCCTLGELSGEFQKKHPYPYGSRAGAEIQR